MLRLVLVRHAKSSWKDASLADHERPLSARGRRDARLVGNHLAHSGLAIDEVLCSSARRARLTWKRIAARWPAAPAARVVPALYLPTLHGLEKALAGARADTRTLLVVGHSPSLDAFVLARAANAPAPLRARLAAGLPTGSVTVLAVEADGFRALSRARARVELLVTPRELGPAPGERHAAPARGERFAITKQSTLRELASLALGSALAQLRANARGVEADQEPGFAHQQRVGVRRLRVHLRSFAKLVGTARTERLLEELRWLFRLLGAPREHDVFDTSEAGIKLARSREPALVALREELHARRARQQRTLQRALSGQRYASLVRDLLALQAELDHDAGQGARPAKKWLRKRLGHRLARVQVCAEAIDSGATEALHTLRKELKKLRYTAELARGAFAERRLAAFLGHVEALQDLLGAWNDGVASAALLASAARALPPELRASAGRKLAGLHAGAAPLPVAKLKAGLAALEPFWR